MNWTGIVQFGRATRRMEQAVRLSSMADYAIVVMVAASRHCGVSRTSAGAIAGQTGLPVPTVQKLVSRLTTAGLLRSARGAGGGLTLARPAAAITVADIVEAVEGPIALTACVERVHGNGGRQDCTLEDACAVRPYWPAVNAALRGALASVSLVDLVAPLMTSVPAGSVPIPTHMALASALEA